MLPADLADFVLDPSVRAIAKVTAWLAWAVHGGGSHSLHVYFKERVSQVRTSGEAGSWFQHPAALQTQACSCGC